MNITVNVKDKDVKTVIKKLVEFRLIEDFDLETLKRAKIPSTKVLVDQFMKNPKVVDEIQKEVASWLEVSLSDALDEIVYDLELKTLEELVDRCNDIQEQVDKEARVREAAESAKRESELEALQVERTIAALKKAGYTITKA